MSRIDSRFADLKRHGRKGLIIYVTAGCPDYAQTLEAVLQAEKAGADIVEIGMPFSDPMADGPVIQKAATMALEGGATTEKTRELVESIRGKSNIPLVIMTYINTILNAGPKQFVESFAEAGIDGVIVPDMPIEESSLLNDVCRQANVDLIQLVAPTTTPERTTKICEAASGFVYCVSNTGVTGVRNVNYGEIAGVIEVVKRNTVLPTAIGFGIGSTETARAAARHADAVIIGSAVVQKIMENGVGDAADLISDVRMALDKGE